MTFTSTKRGTGGSPVCSRKTRASRPCHTGFTIVELMVVILILTILLSTLKTALLSRPVQPAQCAANGPGINPHAGLSRQLVTAFNQRQVVVRRQQVAQCHRNLVADERRRAATHRLGHTAAFVAGRRYPA